MIEVRLRYEGNGKISPASHEDYRTLCEEIEPGETIVARLVRERSSRENRLFHGAIKSAWDNQRGGPMFTEEEGGWMKLRAWLLCEAGHCDLQEFEPGAITPPVIRALKAVYPTCFWSADRRTGKIRMRVAKTIKFATLKHPDFQPIKDKVFELLCTEIVPGVTPEQLMEMAHAGRETTRATARKQQKRDHRSDAAGGQALP